MIAVEPTTVPAQPGADGRRAGGPGAADRARRSGRAVDRAPAAVGRDQRQLRRQGRARGAVTGSDVGLGSALLRDLYGTPEVRAVLDSRALIQGWLDAEAALARAEADVGVIPAGGGRPDRAPRRSPRGSTSTRCAQGIAELAAPARPAHPRAGRAVPGAARTSTGARRRRTSSTPARCSRRASALALIRADVEGAAVAAATLAAAPCRRPDARAHARPARRPDHVRPKAASWPTSWGAAARGSTGWAPRCCAGQLGGAAGTLAALGDRRAAVRAAVRGARWACRFPRRLARRARPRARRRPRARPGRRRGRADRRRDRPPAGHRGRRAARSPRRPATSARRRCPRSGTR